MQLYLQRASVLKDSEKERWSQLDLSYMTDESDAEYNHRSVKQTHKPTWRSAGELFNQMLGNRLHVLLLLSSEPANCEA